MGRHITSSEQGIHRECVVACYFCVCISYKHVQNNYPVPTSLHGISDMSSESSRTLGCTATCRQTHVCMGISIMPGKVNPTQCEALTMAAAQVPTLPGPRCTHSLLLLSRLLAEVGLNPMSMWPGLTWRLVPLPPISVCLSEGKTAWCSLLQLGPFKA